MKRHAFHKDKNKRQLRKRMVLLVPFFCLGFIVLAYRCFYLHISDDPKLERVAKSQYQPAIKGTPKRGNIYDASGEPFALSVSTYSLALRPRKLKITPSELKKTADILGISQNLLQKKISTNSPFVWVQRDLTPKQKRDIEGMGIPAFEFVAGSKRYYPNRELASQVLGAVGIDGTGLGGLEYYYDDYLKGDPGARERLAYRDARGRVLATRETIARSPGEGGHIYLSLHRNIQDVSETLLKEVCETHHAKSCTSIVMEVGTGAVLSMASHPSFNPNAYQKYDFQTWRNRSITDVFEPGSTFKVILASAALESGKVGFQQKFYCENGAYRVGHATIHDHEKYQWLDLPRIIQVSSNIGVYKMAQKVGRKKFEEIIRQFGFGDLSQIDFPGELKGFVRPSSKWQEIDFANVAFGQGILATPIQLASAYATIANRGVRVRPYLVSRITDHNGNTLFKRETTVMGQVLSEKVSRQMLEVMSLVTQTEGTAEKARIPGFTVAGKTGTAQKFINGEYSHKKFLSSFIGIVPAEDPKVVVYVAVDEPEGTYYGGVVAAPVFRRIAQVALRELGVRPRQESQPLLVEKREETESPRIPEWKKGMVPDFTGISKRQILAQIDTVCAQAKIYGAGVAVHQNPPAGTLSNNNTVCEVYFRTD